MSDGCIFEALPSTYPSGEITMFPIRNSIIGLSLAAPLYLAPSIALADPPNLTAGIWNVNAIDQRGTNWGGSTLTFESQVAQGANYQVGGYFNWLANNGSFGRENFLGTLFANNHLTVQGTAIVPPSNRIVIGTYDADLSASGLSLLNGRWDGIPGGSAVVASDNWSAIQSITPRSTAEPHTEVALIIGLPLLFAAARKRQVSRSLNSISVLG
jgi:hypothetical protein